MDVNLVEIFSSIQGEGPDVGRRTLFLRLGGCDLRCAWCDTPHSWLPAREASIEQTAGAGDFVKQPATMTVESAIQACLPLLAALPHDFVSVTGGEPLLQPAAVALLAQALRSEGRKIHLETHGLHDNALESVVEHIDVVSMDWKFTSDVRRADEARQTSAKPFDEAHERFLEVARRAPRVIVKFVITEHSRDEELDRAVHGILRVHPEAEVILQPVTPFATIQHRPSSERMFAIQAKVSKLLPQVRVIPQTHPIWGAR